MKYITLIAIAALFSSPALAGKKFMPLKPADHTLIHGKKFMGLGGGKDPLRLAREKQNFFDIRQQIARLPSPKKETSTPEPETQLAKEESVKEESVETIAEAMLPAETETPKGLQHLWPVDENVTSRVSSPFGYRTHPITGKYAFHAGLDIAAPLGSAVMASERGEVTEVGRHKNLGKYVRVDHEDGSYSLYGHLNKAIAFKGMTVKQGDKIGEVGSTGRSTGPHLDYSLRKDGKPVNPQKFLKRRGSTDIALKD